MGRLERDLKKRVKNTKKDYSEWYSEHEQQILQRVDENSRDVDLGNVKAKKLVSVKAWIWGGVAILLTAIIALSVLLSRSESLEPGIPDFTFGAESVNDVAMSEEEIGEVVDEFPQLSKFTIAEGINVIYIENGLVVMNTINGELDTADDFYLIYLRISYTDNFIFFDKYEFEELENQTVVNGTEIEYEAKGTDDYGMYLYYAVTQTADAPLYWKVSCIEGLFDEWLQVMFV